MTDTTTLGPYLRRERERRGLTLKTISEKTKVSLALLEGLEGDDISRWPGGIFRRAFVRAYAQCVGLDPDDVFRRFEQQFRPADPDPIAGQDGLARNGDASASRPVSRSAGRNTPPPRRSRLLGTAADLTVAVVLAFGSAAAGSRLLWPVLLISAYYAIGILLTGTSPMVALLNDETELIPSTDPSAPQPTRTTADRRHNSRRGERGLRQRRGMQPHAS